MNPDHQSAPFPETPPSSDASASASHRQIARETLMAVGQSASSLSDTIKSSSVVFKFGLETVGKLFSPAAEFTVQQVWLSL